MSRRLVCWLLTPALAAAAAAGGASQALGQHPLVAASTPPGATLPARIFAPRGDGSASAGEAAPSEASAEQQTVRSAPEVPAARAESPLTLAPPRQQLAREGRRSSPPSVTGAATSMIGALAVVLALFFLVVWFLRRTQRASHALLPGEAVQLLGRTPLNGRQQMHLVRFGGRLLLLSVTPTSAETLSEITDPEEVDRLAGLCRQNRPGSITQTFRQALRQIGREPAPGGFLGEITSAPSKAASPSRVAKP